ncbi:hypothetical protein, partial [Vibrio owensii]|uniref:hypothetical protein n=1 Tax=Vibrio owensii TaxID=696485 RepID=UPI0040691A3E
SQIVKNGRVGLQEPALKVHVGLGYESIARTLPLEVNIQQNSTIKPNQKVAKTVHAEIYESVGMVAGTHLDNMTEVKQREYENYGMPIAP